MLLLWNGTWDTVSLHQLGRGKARAVVALGLTSLVQPEGLLEVAERGWCMGPSDVHQDGDGAASPGLERAGVGALCPRT